MLEDPVLDRVRGKGTNTWKIFSIIGRGLIEGLCVIEIKNIINIPAQYFRR